MIAGNQPGRPPEAKPCSNSAQIEDEAERLIDSRNLIEAEMTNVTAKPAGVNRADHLAENHRLFSLQLYLWVERGDLRRLRGGAYGHRRKSEQIVRLDDHGVSAPMLGPAGAAAEVDLEHITPDH